MIAEAAFKVSASAQMDLRTNCLVRKPHYKLPRNSRRMQKACASAGVP